VVQNVALHRGDIVRVTGWPDGTEKAPLDYVEIVPSHARVTADEMTYGLSRAGRTVPTK
jgi:hypothetical protein